MTYQELLKLVEARAGKDAVLKLTHGPGIRGVFDHPSAEYAGMEMQDRLDWLEIVCRCRIHLFQLEDAFVDVMSRNKAYGEAELRAVFKESVYHVLDYLVLFRSLSPLEQLAEQAE